MRQKKTYSDPGIGTFTVTKNSRAKTMRLSIPASGIPNVTVPSGVPFRAGVQFAKFNKPWIDQHVPKKTTIKVGRSYELYDGTVISTEPTSGKNTSRKLGTGHLMLRLNQNDGTHYLLKKVDKILVHDTLNVVNQRIAQYGPVLGVEPKSVVSRATKSRWGSCSQKGRLMFSAYVAQLPNELIDYIVIHELAHLRHMNHSPDFWALVAQGDPDHRLHRKQIKEAALEAYIKPL